MKNKIKELINSINVFVKCGKIYIFSVLLLSFVLDFVAFSFSSFAKTELTANAISYAGNNYSSSKCINVNYLPNKELSKDDFSSLVSVAYTKSTYKNATYNYSGRIAFNVDTNMVSANTGKSTFHPTILFSNVFSNHENTNGDIIQDVYELKLMFKNPNTQIDYSKSDNFCYITQDEANQIISESGLLPSSETYANLINSSFTMVFSFPAETYVATWNISNIIMSDTDTNIYYQSLYRTYFLAYINLPKYAEYAYSFDFGTSTMSNVSYLNSFNSLFPPNEREVHINQNNLSNAGEEYAKSIENQLKEGKTNITTIDVVLIGLCIAFDLFSLLIISFMIKAFKIKSDKKLLFLSLFAFFISYSIFFVVGSSAMISNFFSTIAILMAIGFLSLFWVFLYWIKKRQTKNEK